MYNNMQWLRKQFNWVIALLILASLYLSSLYSYILFHTLAELFSMVLAGAIFVLAWNFRKFYKSSFLTFIGSAYLFCTLLDLLHTLAYKGLDIFPGYDANLPTQLWIAARYLQSVSLLVAPLFIKRKVKMEWLLGGLTLVTTLLLLSIFTWKVFPVCYIEGVGLTPFKIYSEYVIDILLAATVVILFRNRQSLDQKVLQWMTLSIGITMIGELAFTFYVSVYGLSNLVGHICKIIACFLFYKAVIETETGAIFADMTQLREAESALRIKELQAQRSLAELQSIYAHTPVGLCFLDANLCYQAINDMLAGMNGRPAAEHIGKNVYEILPAEIAQPIEKSLHQTLDTGQPVINQELHGVPDIRSRRMYQWRVSYHPVFETDGTPLGVSCVVQDVTEQRRAEEALQSSERNLKLFIEYAPTSIAMFDREMHYIAASRRYLVDYQLKDQDIFGRSYYEIFPEITERWKEIHQRCLAGVVEKADEDPFTREDGSIDWVRWEIHPWYDIRGEIGGIILYSEVITERKRMQAALQEREKQLHNLGDHLPEGVIYRYVQKDEGVRQFEFISAGIEGITGVTVDEILQDARALHNTILLEDYERQMVEEARSRTLLVPFEMEIRQRHIKTGEIHWSLLRSRPNRRPDGTTVWDGIQLDITERKRADQALCESEKRFRSVVEANMIGVVFADPNTGKVTDANDEYLRIIGHSRKELEAGKINWRAITSPEGLEKEEQAHAGMPRGQRRNPYEKEYIRPDGSRVPVIIGGSYLDEECHQVVAFVLDNTERKQMTEELAEAHLALQSYAARLKRSNQELEQFAFVASHDLQEPLRKIKMFGNRIQRQINEALSDEISEDIIDDLRRMQNATERMQTMIEGLLELSRIHTNGGTFEATQLKSVVDEVVSDLEARIQATGGHVTVGDLYSAEVDVMQIRRLFQNLIGNALKFHKAGESPFIEVNTAITHSIDRSFVTISVKDNGIGFDEQYAERIFQPFQRLHGKNEYEGTGLGLSICQKIVERHHGKIEVHSTPGEGSTFTIALPIKQAN